MMNTQSWFLATVVFTVCAWMPYVLDRFFKLGISRTLANPKPGDAEALAPWAQRAKAAHANAVENLVVFAPLAVLLIASGQSGNALATNASAAYFFSRLGHYLFYSAGIPALRTLSFLGGFAAQLVLVSILVGGAS